MTTSIFDIKIGDTASYTKTIIDADVVLFSCMAGSFNPLRICDSFGKIAFHGKQIVNNDLISGFIRAVLNTELPGPRSVYLKQNLEFVAPVYTGDTITACVEVTARDPQKNQITLSTRCINQDGREVIRGEALMRPSNRTDSGTHRGANHQ